VTDKELVESFIANPRNLSPYNEIVKKYEPIVFNSSLKYLRNKEAAEEISQEVFLKIFSKINTLKDYDNLKGWILRITANACSDRYRKRKRKNELQEKVRVELKIETDFKETNKENDQTEFLREAIDQLNSLDREIVMLHYFSELKINEISEQINLGKSAVKMRLYRSREKLSEYLNTKSDLFKTKNVLNGEG
jgi:RNA polymerase sigma-70 factor (ECF subfamily)